MPEFEVHQPTEAAEAVRLVAELPQAMYVAGGTDLLPNLKQGLHQPRHLVSLARVAGLSALQRLEDGTLRLGATTSLHAVATSPLVQAHAPGLAMAAAAVAGPQHRRMGTLGGNVMLDTRCLFYNQGAAWRQALGHCLKKDGDWCHVVGSKATCVAAQSADTVPMLIALGASIEVQGPDEATTLGLLDLYKQDGRFDRVHALPPGALLTAVRVPPQPPGHRSVYRKVRSRAAIDFPQLSLALAAAFDGPRLTALNAVVGALMPKPRVLRNLDAAVGTTLDDETIEALAEQAWKQTRPQPSLHGDTAWRRHMARVEMRRGLRQLRNGTAATASKAGAQVRG